jgi:hypothetical protein
MTWENYASNFDLSILGRKFHKGEKTVYPGGLSLYEEIIGQCGGR